MSLGGRDDDDDDDTNTNLMHPYAFRTPSCHQAIQQPLGKPSAGQH